jgi:hypothetical protein
MLQRFERTFVLKTVARFEMSWWEKAVAWYTHSIENVNGSLCTQQKGDLMDRAE